MKIDVTSMFFNSKIEGQTATPAWGTSIGQSKSRECRIDDFKQEVVDMVIGMTYRSVSDLKKLDMSKGSPGRDVVMCSVFDAVYVNGRKLDDVQYTLLLVREHSKSHEGRLIISYAPYISYDGVSNLTCITKMQDALGCTSEGCWFVYDITIKNQSDLYFNAVVVDANCSKNYKSSSKDRSEEWKAMIPAEKNFDLELKKSIRERQRIFYGAPGTGKSRSIKYDEKVKRADALNLVFRTTFHPDSDYSTFVGAFKPTMKPVADNYKAVAGKDEEITYEFVPQAFLQAYIAAWNNPEENVFLVIEEINRGNCAQIFGDLFQLLDRDDDGYSEYPINADRDLAKYLNGKNENDVEVLVDKNGIKEGKLKLPKNLYIWATMNTSDQSLFPIDSAFKRRWDWKYIPIDTKKDVWYINVGGVRYSWTAFLEKINNDILTEETAEDKHLGFYFCKAFKKEIDAETFVGKVLFYLWNDVFKVYGIPATIGSSRDWAYTKFYSTDGSVDEQKVKDLMKKLNIPAIVEETDVNQGESNES